MKTLIVATSRKPANWEEEINTGCRYKIEYLELSKRLSAPYVDYDPPGIHNHKIIRKIEERIRFDFYWAYKIARSVRENNYDAVISFSERAGVPLGQALDKRQSHVAILINAFSRKWKPIIKILNSPSKWTKIVVYSRAEANALQREFGIESEKIQVIHNYVDTHFFRPSKSGQTHPDAPYILSQGLAKRDYPTLINAMQQLPHVQCHINATSAWDTFKAGYESMEIPPNVHLKTYDHPFLIRESIDECLFMVIPIKPQMGQWCTGSTSVLQAQAMRKPIVVTDIPGIREYMIDGETGFLVEGQNPEALAGTIDQLWQNRAGISSMGQYGQHWVRHNFSLDTWLNHMIGLLNCLS